MINNASVFLSTNIWKFSVQRSQMGSEKHEENHVTVCIIGPRISDSIGNINIYNYCK